MAPQPDPTHRPLADPALAEALGALETALETPMVPGELDGWAGALRDAAENLQPLLGRRITTAHRESFSQIEATDPELIRRVENLKTEDERIQRDFQALSDRIADLAARAPDAEPDEGTLDQQVSELVDEGLAFVIRLRKQEVALRTWLVEAFQRDRGPVD
jgi:hypothetical protein